MTTTNSVNKEEIKHFAKNSSHWWDEDGPFKPLHILNPERISYIRQQIYNHFDRDNIKDLNIIDIGCGGGLVCEPLTRLGAKVTGLDADKNAIHVAQGHAGKQNLDINYQCMPAEEHAETKAATYDVVMALEIIEHVNNVDEFIKTALSLCKKDGLVIFSTLNRTAKSFLQGIVAAEYILNWVPKGTHSWQKFVKPSELARPLRTNGAIVTDITGLTFDKRENKFILSDKDTSVNYFITARAS